MDKELEKLIHTVKKIQLSPQDKLNVRDKLLLAMKTDVSVPSPYVSHSTWQFWSLHSKNFSVFAILMLLIGISGGTVFGSQSSLPGDILYPIKTQVVENIARAFNSASPIAEVNFETGIMEKRLQEAEMLDQKKELGTVRRAQIGAALVVQENRVQNALIKLTVQTEETASTSVSDEGIQSTMAIVSTTTSTSTPKSFKNAGVARIRNSVPKKTWEMSTTTILTSTSTALISSTTIMETSQDEETNEIKKINSIILEHHQIMEKIQSSGFLNEDSSSDSTSNGEDK